ncbi:MAG TPA: efflux RND transporter periplasmic adaptor subunit [Gemmataceae bacterium]|nr:efflux RND transporter periplasmic adaptor subunit [Gemmataceae bacterium]
MHKLIPVWLLVGMTLSLMGCGARAAKKPNLGEIERVPRLETITPEKQASLAVRREYTATVEPFEKADLYAQVRGMVQTLGPNAEIGRSVRGGVAGGPGGEVLIVLDIPDLVAERDNKQALQELAVAAHEQAIKLRNVAAEEVKEAEAQKKRHQADVEYRDLQHQRAVRLVSQDTVQKQLAEEARLQHKTALAAVEAAVAQVLTREAKLRAAEGDVKVAESKIKVAQTELARLNALVAFATIRAPFDGVVTKRWVDRGTVVKDSITPLLQVMRTDVVRVLIDVPERDVPYFRARAKGAPGNNVLLRVPALHEKVPGSEFPGEVTYTAEALDPVTRTMRVEIHVPNPDRHLKPQMTGTAQVVLDERKDVFTVPSSALVRQEGKTCVYHIAEAKAEGERGVVRRAVVEVGQDDGRVAEVRYGLTGQERIITKGNGVVREGDFAIAVPVR